MYSLKPFPGGSLSGSYRKASKLVPSCKHQPSLHAPATSSDYDYECSVESHLPSPSTRPQFEVAYQVAPSPVPSTTSLSPTSPLILAAALVGAGVAAYGIKKVFDTPSRTYDENVGEEYDAWTTEGILEYYWGEHIHLGYYTEQERAAGYLKKDFKKAKFDFTDEMLKFSGAQQPKSILDVGCGIGGSSRHMAKRWPDAKVQGITLAPKQVERATKLAKEQGVTNASFQVMDALKMDFPDNTFDLVWACESGEHMPDKKKYVEEMVRVLKPGGSLVIACWCQREETPEAPFSTKDKEDLQFLYDEWAHPFFISYQEFGRLMLGSGAMGAVVGEDWTAPTLPSWRHSIWVGVVDPWIVVSKPPLWYKTMREIVTIERMHRAFDRGLMQYGLIRGTKVLATGGQAKVLEQATAGRSMR